MNVNQLRLPRRLVTCAVCFVCWNVGTGLSAAITGVSASSASVTVEEGGVPFYVGGASPIPSYPSYFTESNLPTTPTSAGFGGIDIAYLVDQSSGRARVIIPDTGFVALASQGAPDPGDGAISVRVDFTIDFSIDAGGTPATSIPIVYPIAFGTSHPGMTDSFEAEINYSLPGPVALGTSALLFSFTNPGPGGGGSPYFVVSGATIPIPAIVGPTTLTLDGFFELTADGFSGGSTEIEVFGIPEPSSGVLFASISIALPLFRTSRRRGGR